MATPSTAAGWITSGSTPSADPMGIKTILGGIGSVCPPLPASQSGLARRVEEELAQFASDELGLLFNDPMAAVRNQSAAHVDGNTLQ